MSDLLKRRQFIRSSGLSLGGMAMASLTSDANAMTTFAPKAKRVIYLFMHGGPSQLDLFDHKPGLKSLHGQELPPSVRGEQRLTGMTSGQTSFPVTSSMFSFARHGKSGAWVSELLPHTATVVDDLCVVHSMHTEAINHDPAVTYLQTGHQQPGRPSFGAWLSYGLGCESRDLPAFVVMVSRGSAARPADPLYARLWGSGFLPSNHQGVSLRASGDPVLYLSNPDGIDTSTRRDQLDVIAALNRGQLAQQHDPEIATRISQYEMAFRMQSSVPDLTDLNNESDATFDAYGPRSREPGTFAANCLLARRMAERGVRFIQLYHRGWDQHYNLPSDIRLQCGDVDQPAAALISDLKQRGLLDETLVIWGGEFGRTTYSQGKLEVANHGRDHHGRCFTMWMAGGGIRPGIRFGETDDFCYNIVRDPVHVHDLNATLLHQLGLDHERLTYRFQGRDYRLTDVYGKVVKGILIGAALMAACFPSRSEETPTIRYNRDVRPILADNCFKCHGFDKAQRKAGLRLDSVEGATMELESGARAIIPGNVTESALIERILAGDMEELMPPKKTGKSLSAAQKNVLKRWIEQGAEYEPHWAYTPPQGTEPPVLGGVEHPVDRFIRARLSKEAVSPSPEADRAVLIRRVTLDLTGLPPTALEVDAYLNDTRGDAYERVVDRLLASEHFGERWARWWLDLAHYADSDGYLQDFIRPVAWRYRQWVVDAFNRDMPFDQFTVEQLAGDLLPDATESQRMGTGFLRNTLSNREGGADLEEYRVNQVIDRTATLGTTWLGLTTGCAQCHDHKFDAISQREFYQLYAFFNNADEVNFDAPLPGEREAFEAVQGEHDIKRAGLIAPMAAQIVVLQADWEKRLLHAEAQPNEDFAWDRTLELLGLQWGQSLGEGQLEGLNIVKTPLLLRTRDQSDRLLDYFLGSAPSAYNEKFNELNLSELRSKLDALAKELPPVTRAPGMTTFPTPRATHLHIRGEFRRKGEEVRPGTPAALPALKGGADRLALARWLVSPEHPLTARVAVNRLWQELFGRGLVSTSDNFGVRGDLPSHPELLDWIAVEFMREGWSVKAVLRELVLSKTYRQSSSARPELARDDPLNALVARQSRLRLSGEAVRDSALAAGGLLNRTIGGPSVKPPQPASVSKEGYKNLWEPSAGADRYRRGLYTIIQRTSPYAQFVTFDLPDISRSCSRRERSNTPLQALNLLNDPAFIECSQALAARVQREVEGSDGQMLDHAFLLTLGRSPVPVESRRMLDYLQQQRTLFAEDDDSARDLLRDCPPGTDPAWIALCSILLNLDEFINRE